MSVLPLLASVPHAGLDVPREVADLSLLTPEEIAADGDVGAAEIYALEDAFESCVTTPVARAFVDQNRAEDDFRTDGVVKTHTCWMVPVYREPLSPDLVRTLLDAHYHPYHERLRELASGPVRLGVDLHTMAAEGPPVGPDPGVERPWVCLSNADGTCPQEWIAALQRRFRVTFDGGEVRINDPFTGGFITRSHARELPWVQVELSRGPFLTNAEKRSRVLDALTAFCEKDLG